MCREIKVFPSLKREENIIVLEDLNRLKQFNGTTFAFLGNVASLLDDYMNLPAIITDEGDRVEGLEEVRWFLEGQLQKLSSEVGA